MIRASQLACAAGAAALAFASLSASFAQAAPLTPAASPSLSVSTQPG